MAAVETIYLVAAVLWIVVVSVATILGCRVLLTVRRKRRRVQRLAAAVRAPLAVGAGALVLLGGGQRSRGRALPSGLARSITRSARPQPWRLTDRRRPRGR